MEARKWTFARVVRLEWVRAFACGAVLMGCSIVFREHSRSLWDIGVGSVIGGVGTSVGVSVLSFLSNRLLPAEPPRDDF